MPCETLCLLGAEADRSTDHARTCPTRLSNEWRNVRSWPRADISPCTANVPFLRWFQRVDATLQLRGKRWSVRRWIKDLVEVSPRQTRRSYGIAGREGDSLKAVGRAFSKPSSSICAK